MQGIYGISHTLSIKRRIDKKIVLNSDGKRNTVLSMAESEVLSKFNSGKEINFVLDKFGDKREQVYKIIHNSTFPPA